MSLFPKIQSILSRFKQEKSPRDVMLCHFGNYYRLKGGSTYRLTLNDSSHPVVLVLSPVKAPISENEMPFVPSSFSPSTHIIELK